MAGFRTIAPSIAVGVIIFFLILGVPVQAAIESATPTKEVVRPILKEVALTFDDGPYGTSTQQILDILKKEDVHATFFLIGKNVDRYPNEVREMVEQGNEIGNHTYSHTSLNTLTTAQGLADITKADDAIRLVVGGHTRLMRPPYGVMSIQLQKKVEKQGYKIIMWNVDTEDWNFSSTTSEMILERTNAQKKPHMVIILHDGRDTRVDYPRDNLIQALPKLIEMLKSEGYVFVYPDAFLGELQHPFRTSGKKRAG